MKIIALDGYAANPGDLSWDELKSLGECTIYERTAPTEVLERAAGADILLTNKVVLDAATIASLPDLKYIGVLATGYNIAQQVQHYTDEIRNGRWSDSPDFCFWDTPLIELRGKKIGIIGLGQTGYNTARIAIGFGMEVHAYTSKSPFQLPPEIKKTELDELFANCDIISLHCPLTDSTRELINAARLKQMKPNAILINTGRGPLINEQDLADALNNGTIFAAGLDVLSQEPPRADNPLLTARNCYITPHIAWASAAARERLMQIMLDNVKAFLDGKPINSVIK